MSSDKRSCSSSSSSSNEGYDCQESATKKQRTTDHQHDGSPTSFVTWNVNGFISRCNKDEAELVRLLRDTNTPDIIALQEVRMKASGPHNRGTPLATDYSSTKVQKVMEANIFHNYDKYYSLADARYAGTCTLIHKRLAFDGKNNSAFSFSSALSLLLDKYNLIRQNVNLGTIPYEQPSQPSDSNSSSSSSSSSNINHCKNKKQTSMKAFFAPKATNNNNNKKKSIPQHDSEGRLQFFFFPTFDLMQTYVPNNGTKSESFQRRQEWDTNMKAFLHHRRLVLEQGKAAVNRPLLWCGDLNVAKDYRDRTHWERPVTTVVDDNNTSININANTNNEAKNGSVTVPYEWWTDESKCFAGGQAKTLDPNRAIGDQGIPSFTANERRRFVEILEQSDLIDVWRELHPNGVVQEDIIGKYKNRWEFPNWTWVRSSFINIFRSLSNNVSLTM